MAAASAAVDRLLRRLASNPPKEPSSNMAKDLTKLRSNLSRLQHVLRTAEEQPFEMRNDSILTKIKQIAYDLEDLLDQFEADSVVPQRTGWSGQGMWFFSSCPSFLQGGRAKKIKKIRTHLDQASKQHMLFSLLGHTMTNRDRSDDQGVFEESAVIGRHEDKKNIKQLLLTENKEVSIIPIVAPGGYGKTALAQLIFNDQDDKYDFHFRIWVHMNKSSDLNDIVSAIISGANGTEDGTTKVDDKDQDSLQITFSRVRKVLHKKRCLIVLDDLWGTDERQLVEVKNMLLGIRNSTKVILTTCSESIGQLMHTVPPYYLGSLSEDNCWRIFSRTAFVNAAVDDSELTEIGKEIVKRCEGIPGLVHSLSSLLCNEAKSVWKFVRNEELWKLERKHSTKISLFSSTKQIYYTLPSELKSCFAYLSLFPKDSHIHTENLIRQWIALDILGSIHGTLPVYAKGKKIILDLLSVFFLQDQEHTTSVNGMNQPFTKKVLNMHSLVHQFARYVCYDDLFILDGERGYSGSTKYHTFRYALLTNCNEDSTIGEGLLTSVRAICFRDCKDTRLLEKAFTALKHVRVLDLKNSLFAELPSCVCQLIHLRYIDLSYSAIQSLPDQMSVLRNLDALDLSETSLLKLPNFIRNFQKLKYLNLQGCDKMEEIPEILGDIKSIQHLDLSGCSGIHQELPEYLCGLLELRLLHISDCTELKVLPDSFGNLTNLEELNLSGCHSLEQLPESIGDLCFLQLMNLSNCIQLEQLPRYFGKLASLEVLILQGCSRIKSLPQSFSDIRYLRGLDLEGCEALVMNLAMLTNNLNRLNLKGCGNVHARPGWFADFPKLRPECLATCDHINIIDTNQARPSDPEVHVSQKIEKGTTSHTGQQDRDYEDRKMALVAQELKSTKTGHDEVGISSDHETDVEETGNGTAKRQQAADTQHTIEVIDDQEIDICNHIKEGTSSHTYQNAVHSGDTELQGDGEEDTYRSSNVENKMQHMRDEPRKISYGLLKHFTNDFTDEIGSGTFGVIYKGVDANGEEIAVKVLRMTGFDEHEFRNELELHRSLQHKNIVQLLGFCNESEEVTLEWKGKHIVALKLHMALCLEYVHNGSLRMHISDEHSGLGWQERYKIIKGICEGLRYLHEGLDLSIWHLDLKLDNIVLDKNMEPKIIDFGLSRLAGQEEEIKTSSSVGTCGYLPPEYVNHQIISKEFDIFSLGIIITKIIAGVEGFRSITDMTREEFVMHVHNNWSKRLHTILGTKLLKAHCDQVKTCIEIALHCMKPDRHKRPSIRDIVLKLSKSETIIADIGLEILEIKQGIHDAIVKKMTFHELESITRNFAEKVDEGAFGVVYKGVLDNGELVAVKRLRQNLRDPEQQFENELNLFELQHKNILKLKGYCYETRALVVVSNKSQDEYVYKDVTERLLCYELFPNGSLEKVLNETCLKREWQTRYTIMQGICEGLHYLHLGCRDAPIIHMNLKPANIFLDYNMVPKLGDFGLSWLFPKEQTDILPMTVIGSRRYIAPELSKTAIFTTKSDIYSLGVLIIEIVTGHKLTSSTGEALSRSYAENLVKRWMESSDIVSVCPSLEDDSLKQVKSWVSIGLKCMEMEPERRPTIGHIINFLETESTNSADKVDVKPKKMAFKELEDITNKFSEKRLHSDRVYGAVYKGARVDGEMIVVIRLKDKKKLSHAQFESSVDRLNFEHKNILRLKGYCYQTREKVVDSNKNPGRKNVTARFLCYEYLPNGTLEEIIFSGRLGWKQRYNVIQGICQALKYLHEECGHAPQVHMDIRPGNIWLDDTMAPKLGYCGLSSLFLRNRKQIYTKDIKGSRKYMAQDGPTKISTKLDIYNLGILIIEIVTGEMCTKINGVHKTWMKDSPIASRYQSLDAIGLRQVKGCMKIGLKCTEFFLHKRPTAGQIITMLEKECTRKPGLRTPLCCGV